MPNGAQSLINGLVDGGVRACFANPGTSELHFVAALEEAPELRPVLCLFEGVATGAADGYGRMAGRPACTLLHLGPGLAGGLPNLHNARRAGTPLLNVVGDHALGHKRLDAPLESDIGALAGTVSAWTRRTYHATELADDVAQALAAATGPPGAIATLIVPADVSWSDAGSGAGPDAGPGARSEAAAPPASPAPAAPRRGLVSVDAVTGAADALRSGGGVALLIGGAAARGAGLVAAGRVAAATGAKLLCETFPARLERGAGRPVVERLAYLASGARRQLAGVRHLVLAGASSPVAFFAHPGQGGALVPEGCAVHTLAAGAEDVTAALEGFAEVVGPGACPVREEAGRPAPPSGELTAESAAAVLGALLPEGAIVVDEANTSGIWLPGATAGSPPHDWLTLTGGSMGQGLPLAVGAAVACPDRPVLALVGDGAAMYTPQALWTQAREGLDVTTVVFDNRSYAILGLELGAAGGAGARRLLDLSAPALDFVSLARGMGVPAERATTAQEFAASLKRGLAEPGPWLIDCVVPPLG
ncbi:acetolactate synthase large subunit [Streptomyces sp. WAC 01529]|uniref:acetolactate synthase large subunit n=1 Tax=Streptomyces sp. WAC 01529 TaxID=2203205 RepID=UPI000F6DB11A|nr:acetolactate synthase large subunit [Streptomyces sp. WAC 01529]AZM52353.1 acetolactate synthase large subunit [Streptomyces sp. WAC 01529]